MRGIGKRRLAELERQGEALRQDGHGEGRMLLELVDEVRRLQGTEPGERWTPAAAQDALDTLVAEYISEVGGTKRPSNTTVAELIVWNGKRVKAGRSS